MIWKLSDGNILVTLENLQFGTHGMDWKHVDRWLNTLGSEWPPILVEPLMDDLFFVRDGRHRATAQYERGNHYLEGRIVTR